MKTVSIVIVNYNGLRFIKRLLDSIQMQTFRDFETIFIDNASKDESVHFVKENYSDVKIIEAENNGFGTSCNLAAKQASGEYLVFLNEDMYLPEDFLKNIISFRKKLESKQKNIGGIGCKLIDFDDDPNNSPRNLGARLDIFGFPVKNKKQSGLFVIPGSPFFVSRELFIKSEGFNENIFLYGEDVDISWRLKIFGYDSYICHDTHLFHYGGGTTGSFGTGKIANNIYSSWIPIFTNYNWITLSFILPFYIIYILFLSLVILILKKFDFSYPWEIYKKYANFFGGIKRAYNFRKFVQKNRRRSDYFVFRYISLIPAVILNASYKKLSPSYIIKNY